MSVETTTIYRRVPVIKEYEARQLHCEANGGHILVSDPDVPGKIYCDKCDAEWKDEGF